MRTLAKILRPVRRLARSHGAVIFTRGYQNFGQYTQRMYPIATTIGIHMATSFVTVCGGDDACGACLHQMPVASFHGRYP